MKCFAITAEGTHCSREVVSGKTIALDGRIARLCNQHYKTVSNIAQVWTTEPMYISNVQEDNTMTMNEEFDFHAARECSSVYRNMCPNKPMTIIHEYSEGYELSSGVCLECAMIARKTIINNSQEEIINKDFDDKNSFDSAVAKLEGQPYTIYNGGYQGMFLLESCGHPECQQEYQEALWDNIGCICCGEDNCQHYYTLLCLNHTSKEDTMNINTIITSNEVKENNLPSSTVTGSSDRGDKWIKCVKCSKEIGSNWYHANVADVRTCMGAAPAPVKRVYKTDVLTGETVLTNSDLRFFYDSSKVVVFAKAKELREAGVHVFKVAKATKGNQDWYVEYKI